MITAWPASGVRLLDLDPHLGSALTTTELPDAQRRAVLATVMIDAGTWPLDQLRGLPAVTGELFGLVVAEGKPPAASPGAGAYET